MVNWRKRYRLKREAFAYMMIVVVARGFVTIALYSVLFYIVLCCFTFIFI